eukprot:jgi/Psemu1/184258/e_gw1.38.15.1
MSSTKEVTSSHYEAHSNADSYENGSFFYESGAYMEYLLAIIREKLKLVAPNEDEGGSRCIVDIGGGTGNFARALLEKQTATGDHRSAMVVVDPFLIPPDATKQTGSKNGDSPDRLSFVKAPAEDFLRAPSPEEDRCWRTNIIDRDYGGYDQILLKEVVHHFEKKDRIGIFRGMRDGLRRQSSPAQTQATPLPSMLIVTRPQTDIDYPLWDAARAVWKENQPSIEEIEDELKEAGYTHLERTVEAYPCSISLASWQSMVKNRFWSTFSNFSDEELERACESIAQNNYSKRKIDHADAAVEEEGDPILHFEDRMIFLTAY